jgi:hypothetical protein
VGAKPVYQIATGSEGYPRANVTGPTLNVISPFILLKLNGPSTLVIASGKCTPSCTGLFKRPCINIYLPCAMHGFGETKMVVAAPA